MVLTDVVGENNNAVDVLQSPNHEVDDPNVGTSAATATTAASSSCNTNRTSFTNSGTTMMRNQPTTTAMPLTSNSVMNTTTDDEMETPPLASHGGVTDRNYNKNLIHRSHRNHSNNNNSGNHHHHHPVTADAMNPRTTSHPENDTTTKSRHQNQTIRYPLREVQFFIPGLQDPIVINPMVSLYAIVLLWSVVIWTIGTFCLF